MNDIKNLVKTWSLPDRTKDRAQLTLRVNYDLYAKFQALKELYPGRSVNDLVVDVLTVGVEEVIQSLPIHTETMPIDEAIYCSDQTGRPLSDFENSKIETGPGALFRAYYSRLLSEKSETETKTDEVA